MASRTILFTNAWLDAYGGTECVVRDLAVGMLARGHRPVVYAPILGRVAEEIRARGVAVVDDLRLVREGPDVVHGHHRIQTAEAALHFPDVPIVNVCHGWVSWLETPPRIPHVRRYGAVSEATRDRLVHEHGIDPDAVVLVPNAVDLRRFPAREERLPDSPRRVLAFTRQKDHLPALGAAAAGRGAALEVLDAGGPSATSDPGEVLRAADVVMATGRSALEALASGCAVIVGDSTGVAGMVTSANLQRMREGNFALRLLTQPCTEDVLAAELARYDADDAARVSATIRDTSSLERQLDTFEELHGEVIEEATRAPLDETLARAAMLEFLTGALPRTWPDRRWPWQSEKDALQAENQRLHQALARRDATVATLREREAKVRSRLERLRGRTDAELEALRAQLAEHASAPTEKPRRRQRNRS